jgi:hypothetical protein
MNLSGSYSQCPDPEADLYLTKNLDSGTLNRNLDFESLILILELMRNL